MEILLDNLDKIRVPLEVDKVFKNEGLFSFDSPECKTGLYVCMREFIGLGKNHVEAYSIKTGNVVFLHMKKIKVPSNVEAPVEKVSRLAIGIEGGFHSIKYEEKNKIVLMPHFIELSLDDANIPLVVQMSASGIIAAESADKKIDTEEIWDGERVSVSKYAENLLQLNNGVSVGPKGWKCERCDLTSNLWLNLTSGAILCGRKFFDGSGGNNHAVEYYEEFKYPLCVKLGTISKDGKADVFSYAEDAMVEDPFLSKHLSHFGINVQLMEKTDKSMVEIEIDMNQKIGEWATLTESESKLIPMRGPGYTGIQNLGNTCYLNSVIQVLFTLPSFITTYVHGANAVFETVNLSTASSDLDVQMCKLGVGLYSGDYSVDEEEPLRIKPLLFKNLIGLGHPEFSGKQQQDAQEFYLHLLKILERKSKLPFPGKCLQFQVEDRIECVTSHQVKYLSRIEDYLPLPIPMNKARNLGDAEKNTNSDNSVEKPSPRPKISFESCLESFLETEEISDFYSPAIDGMTKAKKTMRLTTFPEYLLIQLKKFDIDSNWIPFKLNVEIDMPDIIDLEALRAKGLQPGEIEMKDSVSKNASCIPDSSIVDQLASMGFSLNGCKKAALHTKNSGVEAAMNWIMEHMSDGDFNDPLSLDDDVIISEENIAIIMSMGFSDTHAKEALKSTNNSIERAMEWIFNHPESDAPKVDSLPNGNAQYKLTAFISHMGTSHSVGHYVCHIYKDEKWIIFNDEKVALSEHPPKNLGYLYLYQRI